MKTIDFFCDLMTTMAQRTERRTDMATELEKIIHMQYDAISTGIRPVEVSDSMERHLTSAQQQKRNDRNSLYYSRKSSG